MDFLEPHKRDDLTKEQIEQLQKRQHEFVLVGHTRKVPGHTLFSYNCKTGEIKVAPVQSAKDIDFMTKKAVHRPKIVIEPDCIYRQALNKKNFIKRLKREGIIKAAL